VISVSNAAPDVESSGLSIDFCLGFHPPSLIVYLNEELFTWEISDSQGGEYEDKL
jgi:hypothetical protein